MSSTHWVSASAPYFRPRPGESDAWTEEAAEQGHVGTNQLLEVAEVAAPTSIALALHAEPGHRVVVRRRLVLLDGLPVELADSYFPSTIALGTPLERTSKIRGGAVSLLAELGYRAHTVDETVGARPATEYERELLQLDEHEWVLLLERVTRDEDGTPYEVTVMTMVAAGRQLRYEMREEG